MTIQQLIYELQKANLIYCQNNEFRCGNNERAEAAFVAVKAYNKHMPNSHDEVIADLLCDLMHLLDNPDLGFFHLSFNKVLEDAYYFYNNEIEDES